MVDMVDVTLDEDGLWWEANCLALCGATIDGRNAVGMWLAGARPPVVDDMRRGMVRTSLAVSGSSRRSEISIGRSSVPYASSDEGIEG